MSVKNLLLDEVDAYPLDVEGEGDPVDLAEARTQGFYTAKRLKGSTPTVDNQSRIQKAYNETDQRKYFVPCPECGHMHVLAWANFIIPESDKGKKQPDRAYMVCPECGVIIREHQKAYMLPRGKWIPTAPENATPYKRGYHLCALYAPYGFLSWAAIARKWLNAQGDINRLKTFINTILGECWVEDRAEQLGHELLQERAETYDATVPEEVIVLTAAVDVQDDRLECEVVGWGEDEESWGIEYRQFMGSPADGKVWDDLDAHLLREFAKADGTVLRIACTCIDSGGHHTQQVYLFAKAREARRIFAIKGWGGIGRPFVGKFSRTKKERAALFPVGVDEGKDVLYNALQVLHPGEPNYCHFPVGRGYDEQYYKGLTSEYRVLTHDKGKPVMRWRRKPGSTKRNEPWDIRNYARAALKIINPVLSRKARPGAVSVPRKAQQRRVISGGVRV